MGFTHCRSLLLTAAVATSFLSACGGDSREAPLVNPSALPMLSTAASGMAHTPNPAVDTFVQGMMKDVEIPGLSLAVMENGRLIYTKAYGYANLEKATPATPEHRYQIGSISKSFAAVAVMLLVEEGKINLDARISTYLGAVPASWEPITVRQLLNHTSGMQKDPDDATVRMLEAGQPASKAELFEVAKKITLLAVPGKTYSYSNIGFNILGYIIGKTSGKNYGEFLQERVFGPLNMRDTRVINRNDSLAGMATGYVKDGTTIKASVLSTGARHLLSLAAGGIESSALDMAKFDAALHNGVLPSRESQTLMWTKSSLAQAASTPDDADVNYGLGWFLSTVDGHRKVYHSGQMPAYISDFIRYPSAGISVVVLTNQSYSGREPQLISRKVAQLFRAGLPYCCDPK